MVHVLTVRTRVRETFQTLATLERLLAAVQTLVLGEVVFVLKRFGTFIALMGTLTWNQQMLLDNLHTYLHSTLFGTIHTSTILVLVVLLQQLQLSIGKHQL